jgi:hypothetical protein
MFFVLLKVRKKSFCMHSCCKYFTFSIMSFFGYQSFAQLRVAQTSHNSVTTVHSAKDH